MNALITGSAGHLGEALAYTLTTLGHEVMGVDLSRYLLFGSIPFCSNHNGRAAEAAVLFCVGNLFGNKATTGSGRSVKHNQTDTYPFETSVGRKLFGLVPVNFLKKLAQ